MPIRRILRIAIFLLMGTLPVAPASALADGGMDPEGLTGTLWKWQQTRYNNDQNAVPGDPSRYTITFDAGGKLNIRADCNRGGGSYSTKGKSLTLEVTHTTRAMCPPDSLDQTFIKDLNAARIYFFRDGNLYLDLMYDTGTMMFGR